MHIGHVRTRCAYYMHILCHAEKKTCGSFIAATPLLPHVTFRIFFIRQLLSYLVLSSSEDRSAVSKRPQNITSLSLGLDHLIMVIFCYLGISWPRWQPDSLGHPVVCEPKYNAMNFEELRSTAGPAVCSFWDFRICQNDRKKMKQLQEVRTQGWPPNRQLDSVGWAAVTSDSIRSSDVASMASKNSLKSTLEYGAFLKWGYFQIIHAFFMK